MGVTSEKANIFICRFFRFLSGIQYILQYLQRCIQDTFKHLPGKQLIVLRCCLFFLKALISSKLHLRKFQKSCQKSLNSQKLLSAKISVFKQKQHISSTLILTITVAPSSTNSNGSERFSDSILFVRQLRFFISSSISSSSSKYPSLSPSSDGT